MYCIVVVVVVAVAYYKLVNIFYRKRGLRGERGGGGKGNNRGSHKSCKTTLQQHCCDPNKAKGLLSLLCCVYYCNVIPMYKRGAMRCEGGSNSDTFGLKRRRRRRIEEAVCVFSFSFSFLYCRVPRNDI